MVLSTKLRRLPKAFSVLLFAAALISGVLAAGQRYAWCPHMQRAMASKCCHGAESDSVFGASVVDGPVVERRCCETKVVAALPQVVEEGQAFVPVESQAATLLTVMVTPSVARPMPAERQDTSVMLRAQPIRAGPTGSLERCILLQVFHC